jgi:hypothetical protein
MRELAGEGTLVYTHLAIDLKHTHLDMLTAQLDRFETTTAGYEMNSVLPSIQCPKLLLQADPTTDSLMRPRARLHVPSQEHEFQITLSHYPIFPSLGNSSIGYLTPNHLDVLSIYCRYSSPKVSKQICSSTMALYK